MDISAIIKFIQLDVILIFLTTMFAFVIIICNKNNHLYINRIMQA